MARPKTEEKKSFIARFPPVLYARMMDAVAERKKAEPDYSLNKMVVDAVRIDLEGPAEPKPIHFGPVAGADHPKTPAAALAAKFAHLGVTTLAKIEDAPVIYKG